MIKDQQGRILGKGHKMGGLYALDGSTEQAFTAITRNKTPFTIWHQRMGHPHLKFLKYLQEKHLIDVSSWTKSQWICISCQMGKSCKLPFKSSNKITEFPLEKIHCDL